jgi:hypothetical protein
LERLSEVDLLLDHLDRIVSVTEGGLSGSCGFPLRGNSTRDHTLDANGEDYPMKADRDLSIGVVVDNSRTARTTHTHLPADITAGSWIPK